MDEFGNTTTKPFTISVYTPTPEISSMTSTGWIIGSIRENIASEPIHFFRVRSADGVDLLSQGATSTDAT
jgi:hypothetical protein